MSRLSSKHIALLVFAISVALTWMVDSIARTSHHKDVRLEAHAAALHRATDLNDLITRETASIDTVAAFVKLTLDQAGDVASGFESIAEPMIAAGETIQSVQLAPDSVIQHVYPLAGNEEAMGLDLLADPDRRAILLPAIETGRTVVQGPVELVQGGVGVLIRKPIYHEDGSFFGFAAILLNWEKVVAATEIDAQASGMITATRVENGEVIAGDPSAFDGDPEISDVMVGFTDTTWEVAVKPAGGWPATSPLTPIIWLVGLGLGGLGATFILNLLQRPELLRRERERAFKELAYVEARYRATYENAAVGIMITDYGGRILSANPAMHRIVGLEADGSLRETSASDLIHPHDLARLRPAMARLHVGAPAVEMDVRMKGDEDRFVRAIVTMISGTRDDDLYVAVMEDVTAQRLAEQHLARSEARFRQLFEQAPIAIQREDYTEAVAHFEQLKARGVSDLRLYLEGNPERIRQILGMVRIIDANPAAGLLQGHLDSSGRELTLLDRGTEPALETFVETLVAIWEGRPHLEQSVETVGADGLPRHLDVRWTTHLVDGEPDYSGLMVTIADITELREAQDRLEALLESKDRFVASVAHELRTPLTAVVGFAQELKDELSLYSDREKDEFRDLIALHSNELANIIDDLLVWARADIGEVKITPESTDVGDQVRRTLTSIHTLDVEVDEPDGVVEALVDPSRLRQIVRNLATNAVRYGGPDVRVAVREVDYSAIVDVSDDGPPLGKSAMSRIFEPYVRSEMSATVPGSIGLGLSVSKSLAEIHGGSLECLRQDGRNVFRLTLPRARSLVEPSTAR